MNQLQTAWEKSLADKHYRIGLHVLFWFVYLFLLLGIYFFINKAIFPEWHLHSKNVLISSGPSPFGEGLG
jgi:hypothetical protein